MEESKRTVIFTVEFENDFLALRFEQHIKSLVNIKDILYLTDTSKLYDEDSHFRKLCSEFKKAKQNRNDYINKKLNKL